ncbi:MAG: hypothetical protein CAPSK01_004595 [Candidatus Accumulibacter vicinus]|uniref:Uncharacterized protein n=1 Tax=Candidatus Accumulibacter vicinus TaxID=2954382 RepID=A0A084XUF6_9PROT|nr:MAG: hypothetical protein CAPSK01_004595 [Candidatus Accumulibacter vicinus]
MQIIIGGDRRERGADRRFDIGGENGGPAGAAAQVIEKALQAEVAFVELVVAEFESVEADAVHQRRVGLPLVEGMVEGAGDRIAGMQFQQVRQTLAGFEQRRQTRETAGLDACRNPIDADLEVGSGFEVRMVVIDVRDVDFEGARRERGGERRGLAGA